MCGRYCFSTPLTLNINGNLLAHTQVHNVPYNTSEQLQVLQTQKKIVKFKSNNQIYIYMYIQVLKCIKFDIRLILIFGPVILYSMMMKKTGIPPFFNHK